MNLVVPGSTGSIGHSAIDVSRNPGTGTQVVGLALGSRWERSAGHTGLRVPPISIADPTAHEQLKEVLQADRWAREEATRWITC